MNDEIDFKALWQQQNTMPPDASAIVLKVRQYQKKIKRKVIALNLILIATSIFLVCIWYYFQPKMITTKIGIVVCILSMLIYLLAFNQLWPLLNRMGEQENNNDYLSGLIEVQRKQLFLKNVMMKLYFLLLTIGLFLYLYEYTMRSPMILVLAYSITGLWIAINWFYFLPKGFKKEQAKINDLIQLFQQRQQILKDEH